MARHRIRLLVAQVVVLAAASMPAVAPAASAGAAARPAVEGDGAGAFIAPPGDRVSVRVSATERSPTSPFTGEGAGRFEVTHYQRSGEVLASLNGTVTCASIGGKVARLTGTILAGTAPAFEGDVRGKSIAITIVDRGPDPDLLGLTPPLDTVAPCLPAPGLATVDRGDYRVSA